MIPLAPPPSNDLPPPRLARCAPATSRGSGHPPQPVGLIWTARRSDDPHTMAFVERFAPPLKAAQTL
ncbi:hypothetical protein [Isosphaera pallida]|uniref:hypothetical protein n=1 Tax=Isosphaera pallida TaxID=128 RepID=UPI000315CD37|nr:hypothetical protein [Isosphaera pallida]